MEKPCDICKYIKTNYRGHEIIPMPNTMTIAKCSRCFSNICSYHADIIENKFKVNFFEKCHICISSNCEAINIW